MVNTGGLRSFAGIIGSYAAARGVTARAAVVYAILWLGVAGTSRFSISALGLDFAPPGSASLDTVAVLLLLLPAGVLASWLESQAPEWEATRSRSGRPAQLLWVGTLAAVALLSSLAVSPLLHPSVDAGAFLATWCITLGTWFSIALFGSPMVAAAGTFTMLATFSSPGLVPWRMNIIYNMEMDASAGSAATILFLVGLVCQCLKASNR